ncbi:MAG: DUF2191 domain-containing protein [Gammaproteobacteria bacterium]|nr:DUF2191 domain-containing protein [Gammaproteobacteria bacterium]
MKTTIEISDQLSESAKACAREHGITLRGLVEQGLRMAISANHNKRTFHLRDASVGGHGLQDAFRDADWAKFREAIYETREQSQDK